MARTARPRGRSLAARAGMALFVLFALVAGAAACEALVGDSIPSTIACTGDLPGICPNGQVCNAGACGPPSGCVGVRCIILFPDAGVDAGFDSGQVGMDAPPPGIDAGHEAKAPPVDAGHDVAVPLGVIGAVCDITACMADLACIPGTDLTGLDVTTSVCSTGCCVDSDCGDGNTCYPTLAGGLCITNGMANGCGASCGTACCDGMGCTSKETCGLGTALAGPSVQSCQSTSGCTGGDNGHSCQHPGDDCSADTDCASGACYDQFGDGCYPLGCVCLTPCCNDGDCSAVGGACHWAMAQDPSGDLLLRTCAMAGMQKSGTDCSVADAGSEDCAGGLCVVFSGQALCTQPCCQKTDCTSIGSGWTCAPYDDALGQILVCQPPKNISG